MRWSAWSIVVACAGCGGLYRAEPGACLYDKHFEISGPERFAFTATLPDGSSHACSAPWVVPDGGFGPPPKQTGTISGWVTAADDSSFVVDPCVTGGGCSSAGYGFAIQAPGASLALPLGRLVSVSWAITRSFSCSQGLVVADAASGAVWFAGSDGDVDPALAKPFSVDAKGLSCSAPSQRKGCGGKPGDDYAFVFTPLSGDAPLTLATGQTGTLTVSLAGPDGTSMQHLTVHNLRSFQTERCDDYWNWAWWAMGRANADGQPE
jgi:hypothetical protein